MAYDERTKLEALRDQMETTAKEQTISLSGMALGLRDACRLSKTIRGLSRRIRQ